MDDDMKTPQKTQVLSNLAHIVKYKRVRIFAAATVLSYILVLLSPDWLHTDLNFDRLGRPFISTSPPATQIDWSRFAYTQYVTNTNYLCNSVMLFESLHQLESKAERLMMYPATMQPDSASTTVESRLLLKARDAYNVKLMPIEIQRKAGYEPTWAESYTKLLAFNQTQYDRVLSLDSDSMVLQSMDELFLLPPAPVAMPRAYWLDQPFLNSQLVLIQPSSAEFARIEAEIEAATDGRFDMEIVNDLYNNSCMILPHRPYNMVSGEFRGKGAHEKYLGNTYEAWDPEAIYRETKFLHFSDWPMPKPWLPASPEVLNNTQPTCDLTDDGGEDCRARDIWLGIYSDFRTRRKFICGV